MKLFQWKEKGLQKCKAKATAAAGNQVNRQPCMHLNWFHDFGVLFQPLFLNNLIKSYLLSTFAKPALSKTLNWDSMESVSKTFLDAITSLAPCLINRFPSVTRTFRWWVNWTQTLLTQSLVELSHLLSYI